MIKIENVNVNGWEAAIRGARNPMNSWEKSDSQFLDRFVIKKGILKRLYRSLLKNKIFHKEYVDCINSDNYEIRVSNSEIVGPADHKLLMNLCKGGTEESKWRRFVIVTCDITAPLYWWKEFDTYKVGTVSNSCSTMHKIHAKEFALEDFSCEHLGHFDLDDRTTEQEYWETAIDGGGGPYYPLDLMTDLIDVLNHNRELFNETKDKKYWWQMIQLLPTSYNQRRTILMNYENLAAMYRHRNAHKLEEWRDFCRWIWTDLPYHEFITMEES